MLPLPADRGAIGVRVLSENRRAARYPFVAKITMKKLPAGCVVEGMTTDLSEGGCGVRAFELFSTGAKLQIEITGNEGLLVTTATVAYCLPPTAMGLAFVEMSPSHKNILAAWLSAAVPRVRRNARQ